MDVIAQEEEVLYSAAHTHKFIIQGDTHETCRLLSHASCRSCTVKVYAEQEYSVREAGKDEECTVQGHAGNKKDR